MEKKYSDYAIVFNWEILNDQNDIGNWVMLFEENGKKVNGKGMSEFLETLSQLDWDLINVIYVKNLNLFEVIGECYFSYSDNFMAAVKDGQINFFNLNLFGFVSLVNWDNYFSDTEDCEEFLRRLNLSRENFKGNNKNKLSLKSHYRITKASDQWFDIIEKFYLKSPWANDFRENLLPKSEAELDLYLRVNKASFYFTNPAFINKTLEDVRGYDISSSHLGFILRKKYPSTEALKVEGDEVFEILDKNWYAWIGEFEFVGLKEKVKLPIDLRKFGYLNDNDNWVLILTNAHWSAFKRLFSCEQVIPRNFFRFENKELQKNYARMANTLYEEKEHYKKNSDPYVSSIFKFRTELPFGQSIKNPVWHQTVYYDVEENEFIKERAEAPTFEDMISRIKKSALPMQIGIWTAAYSWAEEVNMILDLGPENVIYGDTDCVKFINRKDLVDIIENHNKEIDKEVKIISNKRNMLETNPKIGRWKDEGIFTQFKAIGVKWYLFNSEKGLEVKAAGADNKILIGWLKEQENPFEAFTKEMYVPKLFKNVSVSRENKTVHISYNNYMGNQLIRELNEKTNGFLI